MGERLSEQPYNAEENGEHFMEKLNQLGPKERDIISAYSNFFNEQDVFERYANDPNKVKELRDQLGALGLKDQSLKLAMYALGFGNLEPNEELKTNE